jgi:hypothetical protein
LVTRQDIESFRKKWEISEDHSTSVARFRNRLLITLDGEFTLASGPFWKSFLKFIGWKSKPINFYRGFTETPLYSALEQCNDLRSVVYVLQSVLWARRETSPIQVANTVRAIEMALEASPGIDLRIVQTNNSATIYPAGDPLLDQITVDEVLQGLGKHPEVEKPFKAALQIYLAKDKEHYRNLLDNLRFALEQLVQKILGNSKSLENNKSELLKWLRDRGLHSYLTQMYHDLIFGGFVKYQNEAVKHGDEYSASEIEFAIYVTGVFLRLILQQAA